MVDAIGDLVRYLHNMFGNKTTYAFIDSILVSTFSKNTSVSNGIITGITSPTLCSPVGPIFESIHLYQSNLLEYFGFSDSNVIEIGKALGIGEMIPEARKWFNGNFSIYF